MRLITTLSLFAFSIDYLLIVSEFGLGYAWKPAVAEIQAGAMIRFQWTSPPFVTSNQFQVMEVASQDGEYDGTGFHSGEASPTGQYQKQ